MDQKKRDQQQDQQQDQQDRRQMPHEQPQDPGNRNEEETGKPVQLDKDGKGHQGNQPRNPKTEQPKVDQGQRN